MTHRGAIARQGLRDELRGQARLLGGFVGSMWVIHVINAFLFAGHLSALGIHPRSLFWLVGILFAPFLHGSFAHLIANTFPLLILGGLVMQRRRGDLLRVGALSALVGGLGTWLLGASGSVHIGASVLVFGYLGYLLLRGYFERHWLSLLVSALVFFAFGGALWGILPGQPGISWQSHFFGLLGGILAAKLMVRRPENPDIQPGRRVADLPGPRSRLATPPVAEEEFDVDEEIERMRGVKR